MFAVAVIAAAYTAAAGGAASAASDEARIGSLIQRFEESDDISQTTCPGGTLTLADLPRTDRGRTRRWRDVPGNQLWRQAQIESQRLSIDADRATAHVTTYIRYHAGLEETGERALVNDFLTLERRAETWCIRSTVRQVSGLPGSGADRGGAR